MLIQGLLAALTVFAVPRLRTIHALFVANIAALALAVRLHLLVKYGWGKPGFLDTVEVVVAPITMGGMAVALLVALLLRPVARFAPFQR
jgi:hypothetical protein